MGRPQATQISKRLAKVISAQVANSNEELAEILQTSAATILRFRATGLITQQNLKKLACLTFFPFHSLEEITIAEKNIEAEIPLGVRLFVKSSPLTYDVYLRHKNKSELHLNVLWKTTFESMKDNSVYLRALRDVGYQLLVVIDTDELPKLYDLKELELRLPKDKLSDLEKASTDDLIKELCRRGFRVGLELKDD